MRGLTTGRFAALSRLLLPMLQVLLLVSAVAAEPFTSVHKSGVCAMRGECGKKSFFGGQLPCLSNTEAVEPDNKLREKVVKLCGAKWNDRPLCCDAAQVNTMEGQLGRAANIISACPACKENFFNLFCEFTCSPDQSVFVNVTNTGTSTSKKTVVSEISYFVDPEYGRTFYDSCKDVKFSATNGYVMDLIGGGAKNYTSFLSFLGDEKPLGSPFQINFPLDDDHPSIDKPLVAMHDEAKQCNDPDPAYRCSCVDCVASCPELPKVEDAVKCHVGVIPCLSFAVLVIYAAFLFALVFGYSAHTAYRRHQQHKYERLRLLQDAAPSDDEDEGDIVAPSAVTDHPSTDYFINQWLDRVFYNLGKFCATYTGITIGASLLVVFLMSLGWLRFQVETDPVRLWVSPTSETARQKEFFDNNFGPFYRAEQVFLVNDSSTPGEAGPVLSYDTLAWWFDVEDQVRRLRGLKHGATLDDVCYKPTGDGCVVQSITGYYQNNFRMVDPKNWQKKLRDCAAHPVNCLPDFGQPLKKEMILGKYEDTGDVAQSRAMIVTWVVTNHAEGTDEVEKSMDWEESLKNLLLSVQGEAKERGLRLSFNTEISLEQELNKSTNTDAKIVVISYICMFIYASLALGSSGIALRKLLGNPARAFVDSKFTLGIFGIIIVLMSVSASVGVFSACGVKVTLIIAEVIPFLVLAVGVDNIFLITHEFDRVNTSHPDIDVEARLAKALGRMGPSILLSATTETIAFALGAIVAMPAVRNFAVYAAGAVFINALLQVTMFVSVLCLNQKRQECNRFDCVPCIVAPGGPIRQFPTEEESYLQIFIRKTYAPALLGKWVKTVVLVVFLGAFTLAIASLPHLELGLDQRIAIPSDSYLIDYFNDLYDYFGSGPPVYFVVKNYNATHREEQQGMCGRFSTCNEFSLMNIVEQERKRPDYSYIAEPAASWIDDFFIFLNPELQSCCREKKDGSGIGCGPRQRDCKVCFADRNPPWNITMYGMPEGNEFLKYLDIWLNADTTEDCAVAGKAAYSTALVTDSESITIPAAHFRTSHTTLTSQRDFIQAFAAARRIASSISESTGAEVFPYSKFYIFFDQYSTIVKLTIGLIAGALASTTILSTFLLGSLQTALVMTATVCMIVVDVVGVMSWWGVSLNAVSLVNLVICVGIGVEFCAHIARAYMFPCRSWLEKAKKMPWKDARAWAALANVGGSVFSGITITKFLGVSVLAFTRSKIFEIYYFRIWLALVISAALHALVFLPVALGLFGGEGYVDADDDIGIEEDLVSRQYRNFLPNDYDDYSDDEY